jgi:hypothetical protein
VVYGTLSKIDHFLGHNARLSKYKKIEIVPCILSDHNALKLEIINKNNSKKHKSNRKLNNTSLNDQSLMKSKRKLKGFLKVNENESTT